MIRCGHCKNTFNANDNPLPASDSPIKDHTNKITEQAPSTNEQIVTVAPAVPPPTWEIQEEATPNKSPYGLYSFLLIIVFVIQLSVFQTTYFTQNPSLQPAFKHLNNEFNLNIPSYKNLDEIHIIERQIGPHPHVNNALSLQLTIKNSALAEQEFPIINIALTSATGGKIAYGVFTKHDYLDLKDVGRLFKPQQLQQINLTFNKPKKEAAGFEISFGE
jgi:hypothetical protein